MTDEDLTNFGITRFGDRVAIRQFVRVRNQENPVASTSQPFVRVHSEENPVASTSQPFVGFQRQENPSTSSFPARLLHAIETKGADHRKKRLVGNQNAKKSNKTFEIGWLMSDGVQVKQVRQKNGGGTRKLVALLSTTALEIMEMAVSVFFPNGSSRFGDADEFNFNLCSFDETVIDNLEDRLSAIVDRTKITRLRLYLLSKKKDVAISGIQEDVQSPSAAR
jgi:hypothetical protein